MENNLPRRSRLPHDVPAWVHQGARHFITMRCFERGTVPFANENTACKIIDSVLCYDTVQKWYLWCVVVMPDHIHFVVTFDMSKGIMKTIKDWRTYHTRTNGIRFQDGFFEHRIRNDQEFSEKCEYIRMNPVVKGLSITPEDWPYLWCRWTDGGAQPSRQAVEL